MDVEGTAMDLEFNSGNLCLEMDLSNEAHFNGKSFVVEGSDLGDEYTTFEDEKLTVSMNGMDLIIMTRTDGEGDSLDGTYSDLSGLLLDSLKEETEDLDTKARIDGDKLFVVYDSFCTYTIDDDKVTLKNPPAAILASSEKDEAVMTFKVDGDTLTLTSDDGTVDTLTKIK